MVIKSLCPYQGYTDQKQTKWLTLVPELVESISAVHVSLVPVWPVQILFSKGQWPYKMLFCQLPLCMNILKIGKIIGEIIKHHKAYPNLQEKLPFLFDKLLT